MALNREIIDISSDEEDEHPVKRLFTFLKKLKKENQIRNISSTSDDEDDCVILDGDPDKPVREAADDNNIKENAFFSDDDELLIVAEKGQVACRDYPHARHVCARFPFDTNPHEKYCDMCHCYVCDTRAPCVYWGTGESSGDHCHSTDKEEMWRLQRQSGATLSDVPPLHSAPSCSQPINSGEERGSLSGLRSALDRLTVQADRLTGRIKWFDRQKGYGFICPDGGGEDLFIHKSAIKCEEYRCLAGEVVEFQIESHNGKKKAIDVNIPGNDTNLRLENLENDPLFQTILQEVLAFEISKDIQPTKSTFLFLGKNRMEMEFQVSINTHNLGNYQHKVQEDILP